jgi:hypothetical protein
MKNYWIYIIFASAILLLPSLSSTSEENKIDKVTEVLAREYVRTVKIDRHRNVLKQKEAVPDQDTAVRLALAVWEPIYGKDHIKRQEPYKAVRIEDCWYVAGSLPREGRGGIAYAVIRVMDGKFLNVDHDL